MPARQLGASFVPTGQDRSQLGELRRSGSGEGSKDDVVGGAAGGNVVAQRELEANEVLEDRGYAPTVAFRSRFKSLSAPGPGSSGGYIKTTYPA